MADGVDVQETVVLRRYAQYAMDLLLQFVVGLLVAVVFVAAAILSIKTGAWIGVFFVLPVIGYILALLAGTFWVEVWYPHTRGGCTPGMRRPGLRIVTLRGARPPLRAYLLRWLLMAVDGQLFGLVGAALIAFSPWNQRLGDMVARTVVVRAT